MDPDEALRLARRAAEQLHAADTVERQAEAGTVLAEAFDGLDEWITRGGFLPEPWRAER